MKPALIPLQRTVAAATFSATSAESIQMGPPLNKLDLRLIMIRLRQRSVMPISPRGQHFAEELLYYAVEILNRRVSEAIGDFSNLYFGLRPYPLRPPTLSREIAVANHADLSERT